MADKKISQLTGATTPLGGTEEVPLVQSGTTKKVTVANLTAGRDVSVNKLTAASTVALTYGQPITSATEATPANNVIVVNDYDVNGNDTLYLKPAGASGNGQIVFRNRTGTDIGRFTAGNDFLINSGNLKIFTAAKGIDLSANTPAAGMTSQLLNWYEEGTWTGTMVGTTTNPTTPVTATGRYTRIGRNVTIAITFANVNTTGASGSLRINGAPFTASAEQCLGTVFTLGFTATAPVCSIASGTQISVIEAATGADIAMSAASGKYLGLTLTYFV